MGKSLSDEILPNNCYDDSLVTYIVLQIKDTKSYYIVVFRHEGHE